MSQPLRRRRLRSPQFLLALAVLTGLAWFAAGVLGVAVMVVVDLLVFSYLGRDRAVNWRAGRPVRMPSDGELRGQQDPGMPHPAEPDVVADWLHERASLLDLPGATGSGDDDPADQGSGA
jgi:hypothetical protein